MFIADFVWLTEVANKLAGKHRVTQDEVEEVFFNNPRYRFVELGHRTGEDILGGWTNRQRSILDRLFRPQERQRGTDIERARHGRAGTKTT